MAANDDAVQGRPKMKNTKANTCATASGDAHSYSR